ncbi:putative methyltransferase-domain-containing protein, partial [Fomes fomentarius]
MSTEHLHPLLNVLRAYATLRPPKAIWRPEVSFSLAHDFFLDHLLLNPHFKQFPPSIQYQITFWKWAIEWLEGLMSEEDELDERIYTHSVNLLQSTSSKVVGIARPASSYLTYLWPTTRVVERPVHPGYASATLLESRTVIEAGTTGLRTWSASLILAQHILSHSEIVANRRVLELGCGAGFLGIIAATIQLDGPAPQTSSLWLTDVNESVLQRCKVNLKLPCNGSHRHPDLNVQTLDWSDATDPAKSASVHELFQQAHPDTILGADLVYHPSIIPLLVKILTIALTPLDDGHHPVAYMALTLRNEDTMSIFLRQAGEALVVSKVDDVLVARNMFTQATELGIDIGTQSAQIFELRTP